jgi:GDPmannose 4,6-dehydratase
MAMKRAIVTGRHGQDAWYLTELLMVKGYQVTVTSHQPSSTDHLAPATSAVDQLDVRTLNIADYNDCLELISAVQPDEVYHLAGPSHIPSCEQTPVESMDAISTGTMHLLEATWRSATNARFFFASTAEIFADAGQSPQHESTIPRPRNIYGVAKLQAQQMVSYYREKKGMFACSGILYNHESARRPTTFVTRKITQAASRIAAGHQSRLQLGQIDAQRDWSWAGDFVWAMWLMLQADEPADYVVASGKAHRVSDWLEIAFGRVSLDWRQFVDYDASLERGKDETRLVGDATQIRSKLNWHATVDFVELVRQMVDHDIQQTTGRSP